MEDIPEITPSRNSNEEESRKGIFERNPEAAAERNKYVDFMQNATFDGSVFQKSIDRWNDKNKFEGQHGVLETIKTKNGELEIIYYRGSDNIRFVYKPA